MASVVLVACFALLFDAQRADLPSYFIPAVVIPAMVAPLAVRALLDLSAALEAALTHSAQRSAELGAILSSVPVGIAHLTTNGRVTVANPIATQLLGRELGEVWDGGGVEDLDERRRLTEAIATTRPIREARWAWHEPAGAARVVHGHVVPLVDVAERGVVLVLEDVTDREHLTAQLQRAQQLNLAARLASGLAHDLNNLLTVVRASVDALGGATGSPELSAIEDATARGAQLTRRLLALSRREGLNLTRQTLGPVLQGMRHSLQSILPSHVRLEMPAQVPEVPIQIDRDSVQHALLNLVLNARDAVGDSGLIDVRTKTHLALDGSWLIVEVSDDGPGMPADVLARATEAFFTTKPVHGGSGVGLAMVRETMQEHGGLLVLESEPGRGTVAALWFPVPSDERSGGFEAAPPRISSEREREPEAHCESATELAPEPPPEPEALPAPKTHRILLIDDEAAVRRVTERALKRLGHQVTSVDGIVPALALLDGATPIDLIVSDVTMPRGTGLDLIERLRESGRETPVLLTSGFSVESIDAVLHDPRVGFIAKPWSSDALVVAMNRLIASARTSPPTRRERRRLTPPTRRERRRLTPPTRRERRRLTPPTGNESEVDE